MNDSDVNPMKTGLMFVPLGWATMSPGRRVTPLQCSDHKEQRKAAGNRGAYIRLLAPSVLDRSAFQRLLERFGQGAQRCSPSST
jgi:hypothetical protein